MDSYSPSHTTINHHSTGSDPCPINYTNIDPTRNACSRSARLPSLWFAFSLKQCLQSWDQSAPAGRDGTRADPMNFAPRGCLQLTNFVVQNLKKQGQMIEASATILFIAVYNCISIIQCVCVWLCLRLGDLYARYMRYTLPSYAPDVSGSNKSELLKLLVPGLTADHNQKTSPKRTCEVLTNHSQVPPYSGLEAGTPTNLLKKSNKPHRVAASVQLRDCFLRSKMRCSLSAMVLSRSLISFSLESLS